MPKTKIVKLVIVGDTSSGKTSLVSRYLGQWHPFPQPTIGVEFKLKHVERDVDVQLWDPSGSERFFHMGPSFYRNADVVFVTYDITCRSSFERVKIWVEEIEHQVRERCLTVMIACKSDLEMKRCVSCEEGEHVAKEFGCTLFFETSAKTGDGVDAAFSQAVHTQQICERVRQAAEGSKAPRAVQLPAAGECATAKPFNNNGAMSCGS